MKVTDPADLTGQTKASKGVLATQRSNPLDLRHCRCCPRDCGADRTSSKLGWCLSGAAIQIASIGAHLGEEPVISGDRGICNVFFAHCNMRCRYCQNYQISRNSASSIAYSDSDSAVAEIKRVLSGGARGIGFVSPSHFLPQVADLIERLRSDGCSGPFLYNSNGFDRAEIIKLLEGSVDVYLPDLKYANDRLALEFSRTPDYWSVATKAIGEMYRQMGADIFLDNEGMIERGLIIRHLVLPGQVANSKAVLDWIAEQLSPEVHVSLMSQYHPTPAVADHPDLGRTLHPEEYAEVVAHFESLGFHRGWVQEPDSPQSYRPDFDQADPFGNQEAL